MRFLARFFVFFLALSLFSGGLTSQASAMQEKKLSEPLNKILANLLRQVGSKAPPTFDPAQAAPLLAFIEADKKPHTIYCPGEIQGTPAAYYQFTINSSMERLLGYAYNDAIPSQALSPSSLRTAYRLKGAAGGNGHWQWRLPADATPQIVRYAEHEEITPDLFTGAYYGYDVDHTLILYRYRGHNVFLSLSRQRGISEVGKKGITLGGDGDWDYLYSGETGLSKPGLGWVKSYIYDSFSVIVFYETGDKNSQLRCGTFKWLKAGWLGINMVQSKHIYRGLERYASDFKKILENPKLPNYRLVAEGFTTLQRLNRTELRPYLTKYLTSLAKQYGKTKALSRHIFNDLLNPRKSLQRLSVPEMRAVVELEYLKALLGKKSRLPGLAALTPSLSISSKSF